MNKHERWFRDELDLIATLYLHRGGWGNGWQEPPEQALLALGRACHERGFRPGTAGGHLADVLRRAGTDDANIERAQAHVTDVLDHVCAFLEYEARYAGDPSFLRDIEMHPACNPASDPRWGPLPRRMVFADDEVAYICATATEWAAEFGATARWPAWPAMKWCHREDGPALVLHYTKGGQVWEEYWYRRGRLHREDGPAYVAYHRDGTILEQRWHDDGVLIRREQHPDYNARIRG